MGVSEDDIVALDGDAGTSPDLESVQIRANHHRRINHHANQTKLHHTAVGGGGCRGSDPRRTDGRGRSHPLQQTCIATGAGTTCQSPGNVEINNVPPAVSFYPYGNMPYLLGDH